MSHSRSVLVQKYISVVSCMRAVRTIRVFNTTNSNHMTVFNLGLVNCFYFGHSTYQWIKFIFVACSLCAELNKMHKRKHFFLPLLRRLNRMMAQMTVPVFGSQQLFCKRIQLEPTTTYAFH